MHNFYLYHICSAFGKVCDVICSIPVVHIDKSKSRAFFRRIVFRNESAKFLLVVSGNQGKFCLKIQNPGLWNPEYSSRNPESKFLVLESNTCNPESKTVLDFVTLGQQIAVNGGQVKAN